MDTRLVLAVSLFKSSKYRQKIISCLQGKTMTPSEIAKAVNIRLNHVSMVLSKLKKEGLVTCLNEKSKRGRLYELTDMGRRVVAHESASSN